MCLGKIMGLGLVYGLSSAFLGSKAALGPALNKKPPRPMKTAHGTATGRAPQEEQFSAWLVETGRALREHGLTPGLTAAHADWFRLCFDDPHLKGNTMDDYGV